MCADFLNALFSILVIILLPEKILFIEYEYVCNSLINSLFGHHQSRLLSAHLNTINNVIQ